MKAAQEEEYLSAEQQYVQLSVGRTPCPLAGPSNIGCTAYSLPLPPCNHAASELTIPSYDISSALKPIW